MNELPEMEALRKENKILNARVRKLERERAETRFSLEKVTSYMENDSKVMHYMERELQQREKYLNLLLDNCKDFFILFDKDFSAVYYSKNIAKIMLRNKFGPLRGRSYVDIVEYLSREEHRQVALDQMKRVIGGEVLSNEIEEIDFWGNGTAGKYSVFAAPMYGDNNEIQGIILSYSDITSLVEAREAAIRSTEAKSTFLARMSHEIRTPMNAILGMSELALRKDLAADARRDIHDIKHAGANLLSIINDLLDFSKIEAGRLEIIPVWYLFSSLINDTVSIIRMRIMEKPIRFYTNIDSRLPKELFGDEVRLRQMLLNLLGNAVKYTERGFISITIVEAAPRKGNTVYLKIAVSDSGAGIRPEAQAKLFNDSVQVDPVRNPGIEGPGLGLAISKRLCLAMGGEITVESEYGKGSTFTVTVPQEFNADTPFAKVNNPEEKKVLVYDRREIYAKSVCWSLNNLGVYCVLTKDQEAFAEALRREDWSFIFSGYDLYEWIKPLIEGMEKKPSLALMIEWESKMLIPGVRFVFLPTQVFSIADILNGTQEQKSYEYAGDFRGARFIVPRARLLVVDDIATNLKVAEGLMAPYMAVVDTSLSGVKAVELVKQRTYDIVFMDHMMPKMDGVEATACIRAWEKETGRGQVPIIALTANAVSGMREMFLEKGFNDFLSKPIDVSKLDNIMGKWISKDKREKTGDEEEKNQKEEMALPTIPGVDIPKGIVMCGGTVAAYKQVLSIFCKDARERFALLRGFLADDGSVVGNSAAGRFSEGNFTVFTTQVHALKSALASLGATELSMEAALLEAAGKNADLVSITEGLFPFIERLAALVEGIGLALDAASFAVPEETGAAPDLKPLLRKLAEALQTQKAAAIDSALDALNQISLDGETREIIGRLSDDILMTEYDQALTTVTALLENT
jgi:PAS domain S-box-containing protein